MEKIRVIKLFKSYFKDFYIMQTDSVRTKINYVIENSDELYEIRVESGGNIFRIFCCFDGGALVVLFHGFQKKSQKTPKNQIKRAEAIKKEYFKEKKG